jgi:hypothetical protein
MSGRGSENAAGEQPVIHASQAVTLDCGSILPEMWDTSGEVSDPLMVSRLSQQQARPRLTARAAASQQFGGVGLREHHKVRNVMHAVRMI